jgi:hypothetical protein
MRLDEGSTIKKVARLERQEEIEAESEAVEKEIESTSDAPKAPETERAPLDEEESF